MPRYVYKPLIGYTPENKSEFLQKYKESLMLGELLVDILNYDIYVSKDGLEIPIPVTSDLRKEIISFIKDYMYGPIPNSICYNDETVINRGSFLEPPKNDEEYNSYQKKIEAIEKMKLEIKEIREKVNNDSSDLENNVMRMEHEIKYFFSDLNLFNLSNAYKFNQTIKDIQQSLNSLDNEILEETQKFMKYKDTFKFYNDKIEIIKKDMRNIYANVINLYSEINAKVDLRHYPEVPRAEVKIIAGNSEATSLPKYRENDSLYRNKSELYKNIKGEKKLSYEEYDKDKYKVTYEFNT